MIIREERIREKPRTLLNNDIRGILTAIRSRMIDRNAQLQLIDY